MEDSTRLPKGHKFLIPMNSWRSHIVIGDGNDVPLCNSHVETWLYADKYDPSFPVCKLCTRKYHKLGHKLPEGVE